MRRDVGALEAETFDLLVVGAGIYGICAAWDAAQRGLRTALVERGDFCGATSSNSLKIVHGGLRFLQQADFGRMRRHIRERRTLLRIAPHLVRPLPCIMPTRRTLTRNRFALRSALALNDFVGFDRNHGLPTTHHLPTGRIVSVEECARALPGLQTEGISGGALWYDARMLNSERLALGFLWRAVEAGACAANYVDVAGLLERDGAVAGVRARDLVGELELEIRARLVLNTAGPFVERLMGASRKTMRWSKAMNLVTRPLAQDAAVGVGEGAGGLLFFVPWRGRTLVGTTHLPYEGEPGAFRVSERDIEDFLAEVNRVHPAAALQREDVSFFHGGLLPSTGVAARGEAVLLKQRRILDHERVDGRRGLVSVVGVKWTTARAVAEEAVDLVFRKLGRTPPPCRTARIAVRGGECSDWHALQAEIEARTGLDEDAARHLAQNYGSDWTELDLDAAPGPLSPATPVQRAEVLYAVRHEMALELEDVVLRRTDLGSTGPPDEAALQECARLAAAELGWDEMRKAAELEKVRALYVPAQS